MRNPTWLTTPMLSTTDRRFGLGRSVRVGGTTMIASDEGEQTTMIAGDEDEQTMTISREAGARKMTIIGRRSRAGGRPTRTAYRPGRGNEFWTTKTTISGPLGRAAESKMTMTNPGPGGVVLMRTMMSPGSAAADQCASARAGTRSASAPSSAD
jgi:hypothetical protein